MLKLASLVFVAALLIATATPIRASGGPKHAYVGNRASDAAEDDEPGEDEPAPTPEPNTMLSFATAIAVGGVALMLGRFRKEQK